MHLIVTPPAPVVKENVRELPSVPGLSDHWGVAARWRLRRESAGTCRVERGWPILGPVVATLAVVILLCYQIINLLCGRVLRFTALVAAAGHGHYSKPHFPVAHDRVSLDDDAHDLRRLHNEWGQAVGGGHQETVCRSYGLVQHLRVRVQEPCCLRRIQ